MNHLNYADDCIHLKACRRICKFHKINNRGCQTDYCTAYESKDDYYTYDQVKTAINGACRDGQKGYSPGDLLVEDYI